LVEQRPEDAGVKALRGTRHDPQLNAMDVSRHLGAVVLVRVRQRDERIPELGRPVEQR
jgi:hypothetical protein